MRKRSRNVSARGEENGGLEVSFLLGFTEEVPTGKRKSRLTRSLQGRRTSIRNFSSVPNRIQSFTVDTKVQVYFCDPQSPWQRGTNENTNGLLRQYFPKKINLSGYSQADLDKVALQLNQRPRKTLGFETPADKLQASVAPTG